MRIVRNRAFCFQAGIPRKAVIGSEEESGMATRKANVRRRAGKDRKLMRQIFIRVNGFEYVIFIRIGKFFTLAGKSLSIFKKD